MLDTRVALRIIMMVGTSQVITLINWFFFCFYHYNLNSKTSLKGEIDAGIHVHDYVPLDVDFEHGDDGDDAADRWCCRWGLQQENVEKLKIEAINELLRFATIKNIENKTLKIEAINESLRFTTMKYWKLKIEAINESPSFGAMRYWTIENWQWRRSMSCSGLQQ